MKKVFLRVPLYVLEIERTPSVIFVIKTTGYRSSHPKVFHKKVLFAKFTEKYLC